MTQHQPDQDPQNFRIDRNGVWFHDDRPISRESLVKLFAERGLKRDSQGRYWLQSPFEKYAVEVEDVPFILVAYEIKNDALTFTTNLGERVTVSEEHPLELRSYPAAKGRIPYIHVRDGLYARVNRTVYYDLLSKYGAELTLGGRTYSLAEEENDE
ncbi:MAG: DUF1285 domain-containing protein [Alphaproteobacteria bacterium]|nr:DUF1285 domain-containing protein [Alphaproteobacteria bacterium]MCB9974058.1 DUF1285 domain-containing protein [Rhodospirillales bacterium]